MDSLRWKIIAVTIGRKEVFEIPDGVEAFGYSIATKARLNSQMVKLLEWKPRYDNKSGLERTILIRKELF